MPPSEKCVYNLIQKQCTSALSVFYSSHRLILVECGEGYECESWNQGLLGTSKDTVTMNLLSVSPEKLLPGSLPRAVSLDVELLGNWLGKREGAKYSLFSIQIFT